MVDEPIIGFSQALFRLMHFARGAVWMTVMAAAVIVMPVQGEPAPRVYEVPFLKGKHGGTFRSRVDLSISTTSPAHRGRRIFRT